MGFFDDLADRVEDVAAAGGKFAESVVRAAGAALSGVLVFLDREMMYARKAVKKSPAAGPPSGRKGTRK